MRTEPRNTQRAILGGAATGAQQMVGVGSMVGTLGAQSKSGPVTTKVEAKVVGTMGSGSGREAGTLEQAMEVVMGRAGIGELGLVNLLGAHGKIQANPGRHHSSRDTANKTRGPCLGWTMQWLGHTLHNHPSLNAKSL